MAPISRDDLIVQKFKETLRGESRPDDDPSIQRLVADLVKVHQEHQTNSRRGRFLDEFRTYENGVCEPVEIPKASTPIEFSANETPVSAHGEASSGTKDLAEIERDARAVEKREKNTEAARRSRAKKLARVEELEAHVRKLEEEKEKASSD